MFVYIDGKFVPEHKASVSVFDHGFLYGDGAFETLCLKDGRCVFLDQHLKRLGISCAILGLRLPFPLSRLKREVLRTAKKNGLRHTTVRLMVSRGKGRVGLDPRLSPRPSVIILCLPYLNYDESLYRAGVHAVIVSVRKNHPRALDPRLKSFNYLNNILAKTEALKKGAFEGIMLNTQGWVAEGSTDTVFFVRGGTVCTPSLKVGILPGITRDFILKLARELGLKCEEGFYAPKDLRRADEVFLTSTLLEVMPVTRVDGRNIGGGIPGPVTVLLRAAYLENCKG